MSSRNTRHFIPAGVSQEQWKYSDRRLDQKKERVYTKELKDLPKRDISWED